MRRGGDLRNPLQQLHISTAPANSLVAYHGRERSTAKHTELLFIYLLEEGALIEFRSTLQILQKVLLVHVQKLIFSMSLVRSVEQMLDPAPGGLQLWKEDDASPR